MHFTGGISSLMATFLLMVNPIPELQNQGRHLRQLAAQRYLYSQAKRVHAGRLFASLAFASIGPVLALHFPEIQAYIALFAIAYAILDPPLLEGLENRLREQAAKIQELFDTEVLKLPWNDVLVGQKPDFEAIDEAAKKFLHKNAPLRDWYPSVVGELPLTVGRLVCQRANIRWDSQLRERYSSWILWILIVLLVATVLAGIIVKMQLSQWVMSILAPLSPLLALGLKEFLDQRETANRLEKLKIHIEGLWNEVLGGNPKVDQLQDYARTLQDAIFFHRKMAPLVFDWIYKLFRVSQQEQVSSGAGELVQQAKQMGVCEKRRFSEAP